MSNNIENYIVDSSKVDKLIRKTQAPKNTQENLQDIMAALTSELGSFGSKAIGKNWQNHGQLTQHDLVIGANEKVYHCNLIKGKPYYVAVWVEEDQGNACAKKITIKYVGSHENAPYT